MAHDPSIAGRVMGEAEKYLTGISKPFARIIPSHPPYPVKFEKLKDPYHSLVRAVVYQQLSGKAAATILSRVVALFPGKDFPEPQDLIDAKPEALRGAGLSRQKSAALKDIAAKRIEGVIPPARSLHRLSDEEIIERLTAARGVGRWTVEMYLMFTLGRPDVLPIDDLGVRKGAEKLFRREFTPKTLGEYGKRWAPWRSAAAWHLWRVVDTKTPD
ncbi:MAG: DNA-3-methyladenine glycosylase [Pseudomonadota bacterium]